MSQALAPALLNEDSLVLLEKRALTLSKSSILPEALRNKPADVLVILMMAFELDLPPMQAINGINVIYGRPTISPQLMIALIRRKIPGAIIKVEEGVLSCECFMARSGSKEDMEQGYRACWDIGRAATMGLGSKDNYKKQPKTMLRWRAVGEAGRMIFPDILSGLYFPDEMIGKGISEEVDTNEEGEAVLVLESETDLISKDDQRAMTALMRERNWPPDLVKKICMDKFRIGDSSKLNRKQYKEIILMISTIGPEEL